MLYQIPRLFYDSYELHEKTTSKMISLRFYHTHWNGAYVQCSSVHRAMSQNS